MWLIQCRGSIKTHCMPYKCATTFDSLLLVKGAFYLVTDASLDILHNP